MFSFYLAAHLYLVVVCGVFLVVFFVALFNAVGFIFVLSIIIEELKPQIICRLYMIFHGSNFLLLGKNSMSLRVM